MRRTLAVGVMAAVLLAVAPGLAGAQPPQMAGMTGRAM